VRFGVFYEHQLPRPWTGESEYRLLQDSLDQIELADQLGYDYAWEVEHHFLEEYSHSSAPEVFLGAASQRTSKIRLGHGIIQLTTNHPASPTAGSNWAWGSRLPLRSCTPSTGAFGTSGRCGRTP
jgi:hypothetical protein